MGIRTGLSLCAIVMMFTYGCKARRSTADQKATVTNPKSLSWEEYRRLVEMLLTKNSVQYSDVVVDQSEDYVTRFGEAGVGILVGEGKFDQIYEAKFNFKIKDTQTKAYCLIRHSITIGDVTLNHCVNDLNMGPMPFEGEAINVSALEGAETNMSWWFPDASGKYCAEIELAEGKSIRTAVGTSKSVSGQICERASLVSMPLLLEKSSESSYTNRNLGDGRHTYFYDQCLFVWWNWTKTNFLVPGDICTQIRAHLDTTK